MWKNSKKNKKYHEILIILINTFDIILNNRIILSNILYYIKIISNPKIVEFIIKIKKYPSFYINYFNILFYIIKNNL